MTRKKKVNVSKIRRDRESGMSLMEACKAQAITPSTYYKHLSSRKSDGVVVSKRTVKTGTTTCKPLSAKPLSGEESVEEYFHGIRNVVSTEGNEQVVILITNRSNVKSILTSLI